MIAVLHVMGRMAPGGTEHQLIGMLEKAQGKFWSAALCVLSGGWDLTERVRAAGVPVVELEGTGKIDPRRAAALRELASRFDVVHASLPGASAFARLVSIGPNRPALVVSERGVEDRRLTLALLNRALRPMTDGFIGNSPAVIDFIRKVNGIEAVDPRLSVIPNGLDTQVFRPRKRRNRRAGEPARLVVSGRLIPSKRVDLAIAVLRRLREETSAELLVAGDGPERRRLEALADELPVSFLGHIADRGMLADLLRSGDVFLMPSSSEGYPNAVLEALACGVPVVAADIPGHRAAAGVGVRLVADREEDWCQAVLAALEAGGVPQSAIDDRALSFEEVARRHLDAFERAIQRRNRRRTSMSRPSPRSELGT